MWYGRKRTNVRSGVFFRIGRPHFLCKFWVKRDREREREEFLKIRREFILNLEREK